MQDLRGFSLNDSGLFNRLLSIPAIVLYLALALVIGIGPLLPDIVTQPVRPLVIIACLLIPGKYTYRANRTIIFFSVYLFYMTIVFLLHEITKDTFMSWMSALLFGTFFIIVSQRIWSTKEVRLLLIVVFFATIIYTVLLHYYNRNLFHSAINLSIRGSHVNSNAAAYNISSGALCGVSLCLYYNNKYRNTIGLKLLFLFGTLFVYYTLLCLGQRSGFFSSTAGAFLILWEKAGYTNGLSSKRAMRLLLIVMVGIVLVVGPRVTEGTHAERLFDYENLTDDNGREELNERAKEMIAQKPLFGGGYDYWAKESGKHLGLHNGFLLVMVIGGYCAGILISCFFVYLLIDIWKKKSMISSAFVILAAMHMFTDSGLDYLSYIPMILAYVLVRYAAFRGTKVNDVLVVRYE